MNMIGQKIAVRVSEKYNDEVTFNNGSKLYLDVTFNPEHHVTICGEVVALPRGEWCANTHGDLMAQELQIGDIVYFNYLTVDKENLIFGEDDIYTAQLEDCFCYVRSDGISAISNYILVEPHETAEMHGSIYLGEPKMSEEEGYVRFISKPLKDKEDLGLVPGDHIRFHERYAFLNTIEGKKFYIMRQDDVMGKIIENIGRAI